MHLNMGIYVSMCLCTAVHIYTSACLPARPPVLCLICLSASLFMERSTALQTKRATYRSFVEVSTVLVQMWHVSLVPVQMWEGRV